MQKAVFYVGKKPYAVWDPDIREKNLRLLKCFDTSYFEVSANAQCRFFKTDAQRAAIILRLLYGFALETLFSLLAATIQAPDCVFGWLDKYRQGDLELVVRAITNSESLHTRF